MGNTVSVRKKVGDKRTAILRTTLDPVAERGFHNTSMSVVANESGVSTGIIYRYFAGKDELIYELYREVKLKMLQPVLEGYAEEAPYRERFLFLWHRLLRYYISHPREAAFFEQVENSPYYDPGWEELFVNEIRPVIASSEQGIQEGVLKDIEFGVGSELSFGVAISLAKQHIRGEIEVNDALIDAAADACWDAIKR